MTYKGIVRVYRDSNLEPVQAPQAYRSTGESRRVLEDAAKKKQGANGLLLEVTVTAPTQESLVKKINAMLATLDDDE